MLFPKMDTAGAPSFAVLAKGGIPWMSVPPAAAVTDLYQQGLYQGRCPYTGLYQGTTSVVPIKSNKIAGLQPLPPNGEEQNARRMETRDFDVPVAIPLGMKIGEFHSIPT